MLMGFDITTLIQKCNFAPNSVIIQLHTLLLNSIFFFVIRVITLCFKNDFKQERKDFVMSQYLKKQNDIIEK